MITNWITRLIVVFAIVGVVGFDGMSVVAAHVSLSDDAQTLALAASTSYRQNGTLLSAETVAVQQVPHGETLVAGSFRLAADGTVTLSLRKTASSLILHMFKQTRRWAVVTVSGSARSTA